MRSIRESPMIATMESMSSKSNVWLVVEDDDDDFFLLCRACALAFDPQPLIHREVDGSADRQFLSNNPGTPKLIVSDLKMPNMDGLELLQWVRSQDALSQVRFIMLSNSNAERDLDAARAFGVDDYMVKPSDISTFTQLVQKMEPPGELKDRL